MESGILAWLEALGSSAFRWSAIAFVLVNGMAVAAVVLTRDRAVVNRWTGRLLAANLGIAAVGLGIPLLTTVSRLAVMAVMPSTTDVIRVVDQEEATSRVDVVGRPAMRRD